ncbi:MAG: hypothetical protein HRU70_10590 [Phycisphaeraceae bacterium]|nr:MAG: hypothetical protein HRU70_10590 [Phycisphaeraceae bacterium]
MTAELRLHGKPVSSVFELLGDRENDITFSLGWALAQCAEFRARVVKAALPGFTAIVTESVLLQEHGAGGITDIEIKGPAVHVIIEAKCGLELPGMDQLTRYGERLARSPMPGRAIVTVSCASAAFARTRLPSEVSGLSCRHVSLADLDALARDRCGTHAEKRLLRELSLYLNRIARMQDLTSNMVYVAALSQDRPADSEITWREIVETHSRYFHPVGGNYPREPVNYLGFRYGGQLRSIRHAQQCEVVTELGDRIPGCRFQLDGPHYLYTLGPAVTPSKTVRSGKIVMANRVYAAIDLLLTCDTISEAGELTRHRLSRG